MTRILTPRRLDASDQEDDRLYAGKQDQPLRWRRALIWFMRLLALLWLVKGLDSWAAIMSLTHTPPAFEARPTGYQATVIYFAVLDLLAATGLWLATAWGGVLWLLAVMSHLILAVFFPRFVMNGAVLLGLFIASVMIYLTLSWIAANDE